MQSFLPYYIYVKRFLYFTFNQAGVQLNSLLRRGGFRGPACLKLSFYMVYIINNNMYFIYKILELGVQTSKIYDPSC